MTPRPLSLARQTLRALRLLLGAACLLLLAAPVRAELPTLSLAVLQFGTAHWELDHLKRQGLDQANGFRLEVRLVADVPASRLAVTSGSAQGTVSDLLWAQARHEAGASFVFMPFSSQIGEVVVPEGSDIRELSALAGKRLGVAGGPEGQAWLLLARVAREQGLDLARQATVQFAAPPLLGQSLRRGQVDALLTFWHFAARMRGEGGVRTAFTLDELLAGAGLTPDLPVLGYLFPEPWARDHGELLVRFQRALAETKRQLAENPEAWDALRPLMRAEDEAVFEALRAGFVAGIPGPLTEDGVEALRELLVLTGTEPERLMPASLFHPAAP